MYVSLLPAVMCKTKNGEVFWVLIFILSHLKTLKVTYFLPLYFPSPLPLEKANNPGITCVKHGFHANLCIYQGGVWGVFGLLYLFS